MVTFKINVHSRKHSEHKLLGEGQLECEAGVGWVSWSVRLV